MRIAVRLNNLDIDIYELEESSLGAALEAILDHRPPVLTTEARATAASPYSSQQFTADCAPDLTVTALPTDDYPSLTALTESDWDRYIRAFRRDGNADTFTAWLDQVFFPTNSDPLLARRVFRSLENLNQLVREYPEITQRISMDRWVQLANTLIRTGAVNEVGQATLRTYYNMGRRLS